MKANSTNYNYLDSIDRIDEILNTSDNNYLEKDSIPSRSSLTYLNGYYVNCSALFVDIRGSKSLADSHTRPVLAKIYRTFISELTAVLNSHSKVHEIYIEGDCVWGIFDTPKKTDINQLFSIAAKAASLIDILNVKLSKKNYSTISVGIGLSYGRSLYIKAGYKGSGINEVVWLGEMVGEAAKLCSFGNKEWHDKEIMLSDLFYTNLNDANKDLLSYNSYRYCYHGNVVNTDMNKWVEENE